MKPSGDQFPCLCIRILLGGHYLFHSFFQRSFGYRCRRQQRCSQDFVYLKNDRDSQDVSLLDKRGFLFGPIIVLNITHTLNSRVPNKIVH